MFWLTRSQDDLGRRDGFPLCSAKNPWLRGLMLGSDRQWDGARLWEFHLLGHRIPDEWYTLQWLPLWLRLGWLFPFSDHYQPDSWRREVPLWYLLLPSHRTFILCCFRLDEKNGPVYLDVNPVTSELVCKMNPTSTPNQQKRKASWIIVKKKKQCFTSPEASVGFWRNMLFVSKLILITAAVIGPTKSQMTNFKPPITESLKISTFQLVNNDWNLLSEGN